MPSLDTSKIENDPPVGAIRRAGRQVFAALGLQHDQFAMNGGPREIAGLAFQADAALAGRRHVHAGDTQCFEHRVAFGSGTAHLAQARGTRDGAGACRGVGGDQGRPIDDLETWEAVQEKLSANTRARRAGNGATEPSPLAGKLFDDAGRPLTPSHAVKSGRRYRYYVSRHLIAGADGPTEGPKQGGWREIERVVSDAVAGLLGDRSTLADAARDAGMAADRLPGVLHAAAKKIGEVFDLVERVELGSERIVVDVGLGRILGEPGLVVRHEIAMRIKRRGVEMRLVIEGAGTRSATVDPALVKAVVRARTWFNDLVAGRAKSLTDIANAEGLADQYVSRLMPLAFLAPEIVEVILAGTQPVDLTAETLINSADLPLSWADQRVLLGLP